MCTLSAFTLYLNVSSIVVDIQTLCGRHFGPEIENHINFDAINQRGFVVLLVLNSVCTGVMKLYILL
jgi:hypothetical protein